MLRLILAGRCDTGRKRRVEVGDGYRLTRWSFLAIEMTTLPPAKTLRTPIGTGD
jgi:hypothetical protein